MSWLVPLLLALGLPSAPPAPHIDRVWIALSAGDGPASDAEVRVKAGTPVTAWLVIEARVGGRKRVYSQAPELRRGRRKLKPRRWPARFARPHITFYQLEPDPPEGGIYDNTGTMEPAWHPLERADHPRRWHWCPIDVVEKELRWGSVWRHRADAGPTTTHDYGFGTMRYVVRVRLGDQEHWSPGKAHRDKAGLRPGIATVRLRRDDTPVGYMTELMNVPYVYGSSSPTGRDADHQAERAVGVDCADLVVYGWRRSGRNIAYTWSQGLKAHTRRTAEATDIAGGRYVGPDGRPLKFGRDVQVGDLLLWRRHVAVIAAKDPSGFLTPATSILHTVQEVPALVPLRRIGFGFDSPPFEVRRARWEKARSS